MGLLRYSEMNAALQRINYVHGASGCHGMFCGVLVVDSTFPFSICLEEVLTNIDSTDIFGVEEKRILLHAFEVTRTQLLDPGLGFSLLLPRDDAALEHRVQAVAQWCDGFLFGMALSGVSAETELSQDSCEILKDIAAMARLGVSQAHDENDELAYVEIVEYLRVGALIMMDELHALELPSRK